jgi:hypothetical protein
MLSFVYSSIYVTSIATLYFLCPCDAIVSNKRRVGNEYNVQRRDFLVKAFAFGSLVLPTVSNAESTDEGIALVTDSSFGKSIRRSAIQGARIIDNVDEKWERFSDSLRDKGRCDENTGRRLFDNGFRKDGTPIGNPVLGDLCNPESLMALDTTMAGKILDLAVKSALMVNSNNNLDKTIRETEELLRPSYERSIQNSVDEEQKKKKIFNFRFYSTMRAISNCMGNNPASIKQFQLNWGKEMVAELAPFADRNDYVSPFPETKDEFEDFDYDKGKLLDSLGALRVALEKLRISGLVGRAEIVIPYDDYGSVVTVAIDDYAPIDSEILLSEKSYIIGGPATALVRSLMDKANVIYNLDAYYLDPSTTQQSVYNPSQLLLSLSNLRKS